MARVKRTFRERVNLYPHEVPQTGDNFRLVVIDRRSNLRSTIELEQFQEETLFYEELGPFKALLQSAQCGSLFLVLADELFDEFLPEFGSNDNVLAIFVSAFDGEQPRSARTKHKKVVAVFKSASDLLRNLRKKVNIFKSQTEQVRFSSFQQSFTDVSRGKTEFAWRQTLTNVLRRMPNDERAKIDLFQSLKQAANQDKINCDHLIEFQKEISESTAVKWYTRETFIYRELNKAFRTNDFFFIYQLRYFINLLCSALEKCRFKLNENETKKLYRGIQIPVGQFKKIEQNLGQTICMNGFASTSASHNVALAFALESLISDNFVRVLFEINVESSDKTTIFANIEDQAYFKNEQEYLFVYYSCFKVEKIEFDQNNKCWRVSLNTGSSSNDLIDSGVRLTDTPLKTSSPFLSFGDILIDEFQQLDQAQQYFTQLTMHLPNDHADLPFVYNALGRIYTEQRKGERAMNSFTEACSIVRKQKPVDSKKLGIILNNIALLHQKNRNYDEAQNLLNESLQCAESATKRDPIDIGLSYQNLGNLFYVRKEFDRAQSYLTKALEFFSSPELGKNQYEAACFGSLGQIHQSNNKSLALSYFQQQLSIEESILVPYHKKLSKHLDIIMTCYEQIGCVDDALHFCDKRIKDLQKQFGEEHVFLARTYYWQAKFLASKDREKAIAVYEKCASLFRKLSPTDFFAFNRCLNELIVLYFNDSSFEEVRKCQLECLELNRKYSTADSKNLAYLLRDMGFVHIKLQMKSAALQYYRESLSIYRLRPEEYQSHIHTLEQKCNELSLVLSTSN